MLLVCTCDFVQVKAPDSILHRLFGLSPVQGVDGVH